MEIDEKFLTVLTPEGQFIQARKQKNCVIGEEIIFTPLKQRLQFEHFMGIKQFSAAAAILFILLGFLIPWYQNDKAYAYMSIDGNPSIEIGINNKMQAIKLIPFNDDGKKIISHIGSWKKENITLLTEAILKEIKKQGYLKQNQPVIISTVRMEKPEEKTEQLLTKNINEIKQFVKENNVKPIVIKGTKQDMEKAHRLGMTTGKYKLDTVDGTFKKEKTKQTASNPKTNIGRSNYRSDQVPWVANEQKVKVENNRTAKNENNISVTGQQKDKAIIKQTQEADDEMSKTKNQGKSNANNGQMKKQENMDNNQHGKK